MKPKRRFVMDWTVSQRLGAAGERWKIYFFLRLLSGWIIAFSLVLVVLALGIHQGWLRETVYIVLAYLAAILLFVGGALAIAIMASLRKRTESWLALQLERHLPALLDRVNTLVFLDKRPRNPTAEAYFGAIGVQAGQELKRNPGGRIISFRSTALMLVLALAALVGALEFYFHFPPWDLPEAPVKPPAAALADTSQNAEELRLPEDNAEELKKTWGEVRITEPGGDLKLTKVDVLPLTVEAASSQHLQKASWSTAVNGSTPGEHPLDPPQEPNYAVYQPTIYLDELGLSDWDVLSYFAKASTETKEQYASEIYFVEIKPFREDIMKLESQGGGKSMENLDELSELIHKQQDILRQTYRQNEVPASTKSEQKQDQDKLAGAQQDLSSATSHVYAKIAANENQDVGTVLDKLASAQGHMDQAVTQLKLPDNSVALTEEQSALQQLIESRKDLVKAISEGKGNGNGSQDEQDHTPIAGQKDRKDQLSDIEDLRDEGKAAMKAVQDAREKQEAIAQETRAATPNDLAKLAERQEELNRSLADFQKKVPRPFDGLDQQTQQARDAMDQAVPALEKRSTGKPATQNAADALAALEKGLADQAARQSLGDVYRLKDMMDAQAGHLKQMDQSPGQFNAQDMARAAQQAKAAKDAMSQTLGDTKAGQAFGPKLKEALDGAPGQQLDQAAAQAQQQASSNPGAPGQSAGQALKGLAAINDAFTASQPSLMQAHAQGQAGAGPGSGVADAVQKLTSLIQRLEDHRAPAPSDIRKMLDDTQRSVQDEAEKQKDGNASLAAVTQDLKTLKDNVDLKVDPEALRKLVDRLEAYRIEMADHQRATPDDPRLLHVDPSKVPSEFRERVRRYFEKLSDS